MLREAVTKDLAASFLFGRKLMSEVKSCVKLHLE